LNYSADGPLSIHADVSVESRLVSGKIIWFVSPATVLLVTQPGGLADITDREPTRARDEWHVSIAAK
jgi:hypothetical protein